MVGRRLAGFAGALAGVLALAGLGATPAAANADVAGGAHGYDVSWPQCGQPLPDIHGSQFGVVGVNGGRPFTANPCLGGEYGWAQSGGARPQLYLNLQYGEAASGYQSCDAGDRRCLAFNYGFNAAEDGYASAYAATGGRSHDVLTWWLDVETANDWSDDQGLNAEVVRGAISYLQTIVPEVGVYSSAEQWQEIAGGYAPKGVGSWVVGNDGGDLSRCARPLWGGGTTWVFQWLDDSVGVDEDHGC